MVVKLKTAREWVKKKKEIKRHPREVLLSALFWKGESKSFFLKQHNSQKWFWVQLAGSEGKKRCYLAQCCRVNKAEVYVAVLAEERDFTQHAVPHLTTNSASLWTLRTSVPFSARESLSKTLLQLKRQVHRQRNQWASSWRNYDFSPLTYLFSVVYS